MPHYKVLFNYF